MGIAINDFKGFRWLKGLKPPTSGSSRSSGSCNPEPELDRLACFSTDRQWRIDAVRYVRARTQEGESIYVGLDRHDKIFINDILFYFLADRPPATKWYHFDPGLQTSMEIQNEMVAELESSQPRLVVLENEWSNVLEPNESAKSSGVTVLDDFIRRNYRLAQTFGTISVLQSVGRDELGFYNSKP